MADAPRGRGGFGSRGDRGRGRGRRGRRGGQEKEKEWQPVTKLGRLVKAGKITSMEQIYLHSLPVKEFQIVDYFLPKLKDEVMKVCVFFFFFLNTRDMLIVDPDQTRSEANPCRSAYSLQGRRGHWRLGGPRRSRHQDFQGGGYCYPSRHHNRQAECFAHPSRILGYQPW